MKKATEVVGLKVMGIREGLENGVCQDFMIDPAGRKVEYMILQTSGGYGFRAIAVSDVMGIGADYIMTATIENAKKMYESREILEAIEKGFYMLGTTALSSSGDVIGKVADFTFDEKNGKIGSLVLENGSEYEADKIASLAGKMVFLDTEGGTFRVQVAEAEEKSQLEEESMAYLLGRTVKSAVAADDGSFRIEAGVVLTEELLKQAAKYPEVLLALTMDA